MSAHPGVKTRHQSRCSTRRGATCDCSPSYQAVVYDRSTRKKIYSRRFAGKNALQTATKWRRITLGNVEAGRNVVVSRRTLNQVAEEFLAGAEATPPTTLTRDQRPYKPSVLRDYRAALEQRVLPDLGARRISDVRRADVKRLVTRFQGEGLSGSRIRNVINSLRAVYRVANENDETDNNPCQNLKLPKAAGKRERILSVVEGITLLKALPEADRALWSTALYAGLRAGELQALAWSNVDLDAGVIRVRHGWDEVEGQIAPKSESGVRDVPLMAAARHYLVAHRLRCPWSEGLVFGRGPGAPFVPSTAGRRAQKAWKDAGLQGVTLHEARHCYVSLMAHSGVPVGTVSKWAGHSDVKTTMNIYAKLMPEAADEAVALANAYLATWVGQTG